MNVAHLPTRTTLRTALPAPLRRIAPADAAATRAVYAQPPWLLPALALRGEALRLVWQDTGRGAAPVRNEGLQCTSPGGPFWLGLDDWAVLDAQLGVPMPLLPREARLGLVEQAAEPLLALLPRLTGGPIACTGLALPPNGTDELCLGFCLLDAAGATLARGCWVGAASTLALPPAALFDSAALARLAPVPVALAAELGRCTLPWAELASLAAGDLLRMDVPPRARQNLRVLARLGSTGNGSTGAADGPGSGGLLCSVTNSTLTVEACVGTAFDTLEAGAHNAPSVADLGQIPCTVVLELGRITLTMGELARVRAGHTFELAANPAAASVRLVVQGRTIGRGELVAVGDELAVAVQSIDLPSDG